MTITDQPKETTMKISDIVTPDLIVRATDAYAKASTDENTVISYPALEAALRLAAIETAATLGQELDPE